MITNKLLNFLFLESSFPSWILHEDALKRRLGDKSPVADGECGIDGKNHVGEALGRGDRIPVNESLHLLHGLALGALPDAEHRAGLEGTPGKRAGQLQTKGAMVVVVVVGVGVVGAPRWWP